MICSLQSTYCTRHLCLLGPRKARYAFNGLMERKLRIVKRTPIAVGFCQACNMEFNSMERLEDDAEEDLKDLFAAHICKSDGEGDPSR